MASRLPTIRQALLSSTDAPFLLLNQAIVQLSGTGVKFSCLKKNTWLRGKITLYFIINQQYQINLGCVIIGFPLFQALLCDIIQANDSEDDVRFARNDNSRATVI